MNLTRGVVICVLLAAAPASEAQQAGQVWRIGLFHVGLDHAPPSLDPLREGLKALGYDVETSPAPRASTIFEGRNIRLDWRNLPDEDAARRTAEEFVRDRVDLIVAFENQTVRAAQASTAAVPVLFLHVTDPVAEGFAKSLARPGGNLTGIADYLGELEGKRLELFKELVPGLRRFLVLTDHTDPATPRLMADISRATGQLKVKSVERSATTEADLRRMFASLKTGEVDGVFIVSPKLITKFPSLILHLSSERRLPLGSHRKEEVKEGALFSYGPDFSALGRGAARYVDKLLKGTKPADLSVEQASRPGFTINLKTAKALGLTTPLSLLLRGDQVIE